MRAPVRFASLIFLLSSLMGCGVSTPVSSTGTNNPLNLTGNWQIESASSGPGSTTSGVLLLGSLVSSGAKVTGTFRYTSLAAGAICGNLNQVITVSGTLDASQTLSQSVTLTSPTFNGSVLTVQLTIPLALPGSGSGSMQVTGGSCALASSQALALEYPAVTGTYSGAVTAQAGASQGGPASGSESLVVTQSSTPAADGQFPVSGTLTFVSGSCTSSAAVTGTASGPLVSLQSTLNPLTASNYVIFTGGNAPTIPIAAGQLQAGTTLFYPAPCSSSLSSTASYTGNLVKQ